MSEVYWKLYLTICWEKLRQAYIESMGMGRLESCPGLGKVPYIIADKLQSWRYFLVGLFPFC